MTKPRNNNAPAPEQAPTLAGSAALARALGFTWTPDPEAKRARLTVTAPEGWTGHGPSFVGAEQSTITVPRFVLVPTPGTMDPIMFDLSKVDGLFVALAVSHGLAQSIGDAGAAKAGTAEEDRRARMMDRIAVLAGGEGALWFGERGGRTATVPDPLAAFVRAILASKVKAAPFTAALKAKGVKAPGLTGSTAVMLAAYRTAAEAVTGVPTPDEKWGAFEARVLTDARAMAAKAAEAEEVDPFA